MDKLDGELRQRAARYRSEAAGEIVSQNELRQISRMLEPDVAAMVFYESVLYSKLDSDFINLVNGTKLNNADKEFNRKTEVAVIPSVFANSGLEWGSEADLIRDDCRALGFRTEVVDTLPTNTLNENAKVIGEYLRECSAQSVILLSRNRGSAELRLLLQERGPDAIEFEKLKGWVSVTGIVRGSQILTRLKNGETASWREWLIAKYFRLKSKISGESPTALEQAASDYLIWEKDFRLPPATTLVQILGISRTRHLSSIKGQLAKSLQKTVGPNDGVLFVEESWLELGLRYPVWGLHSSSPYQDYKNIFDRVLLSLMQGQKFLNVK